MLNFKRILIRLSGHCQYFGWIIHFTTAVLNTGRFEYSRYEYLEEMELASFAHTPSAFHNVLSRSGRRTVDAFVHN